jgi:hypothetical protein
VPPTPPLGHEVDRINNPSAPTKTIQAAIDLAFAHLLGNYHATNNHDQEAVVHLMPGIYGPATAQNGQIGNDETYPITMRDRVHVRGVNARRCVIRGLRIGADEYVDNLMQVFWPISGTCSVGDPNFPNVPNGYRMKEVLVDYTGSGSYAFDGTFNPVVVPWAWGTAELLDGVTLQGGDVQVYFGFLAELPLPLHGRIANNLFDMRDFFTVENNYLLTGPSMGLLVATSWMDEIHSSLAVTGEGYIPQEAHIAGNTFLMAELVYDTGSQTGTWEQSRVGSVGVLDTSFPICVGVGDPDGPKGVNHMGLQNNLFRTFTDGKGKNLDRMAMIGVSADDALLDVGGTFMDTNAYGVDRCGSATSGTGSPELSFVSPPASTSITGSIDFGGGHIIPLWNGPPTGVPPGAPSVPIWDGKASLGTQYDPAFVGEYLRTVSPAKLSYRDWRLIPGSPLQDKGRWNAINDFMNPAVYPESDCDALKISKWDHEGYGNPRIIDGNPDIGFDEVQLGVICGSYANHSYSHNHASSLNPQMPSEQDTRFVMLRRTQPNTGAPLAGRTLRLVSNEIVPGPGYRAWTVPPGSLTAPSTQSNSLPDYNLLYTSTSPGGGVPWMQTYFSTVPSAFLWPNWQSAPAPQFQMSLIQLPADDETVGFTSWVNAQPVVLGAGFPTLFGSMQPEYR